MAELTVPLMNFSALGNLGNVYREAQDKQGLKEAFAGGIGNDPQSLAALAQKVAPYNPQMALSLATLAHTQSRQDKSDATSSQRDARDFNFRVNESARAQANADRAFNKEKYVIKEDANGNLVRVNTEGPEGLINTGGAATGNPFSAGGKFNEGQGKAAGFADRMLGSESILSGSGPGEGYEGPASPGVQGQGASRVETSLSKIPFAGNYLTSSDQKSYEQAKRTFINSQLRRESGATIQDAEFINADKQYFPQPGDDANTIAQKAATRRSAIEAMGREGGPSYRPQQTYDKHGKVSPYAAPKAEKPAISVPTGAVDALRKDPRLIPQFDAKYGKGAAKAILGGGG